MMTNLIKQPPYSPKKNFQILLVLLIIVSGFVGMELFFPSLPGVASILDISTRQAQYSISLYLLGYGITQLIYGPLSDRFGRRPMLLVGFSLFILGSLIGGTIQNLTALLLARILQGMGMGACATLSRTILRDLYSGTKMAKVGSLITIGITAASIISPIIGGYIQHMYGYRMNLMFMALFGVVSGGTLFFFFDETNKQLNACIPHLWNESLNILKNKSFIRPVLTAGLILSVFIFLGQTNPFILQDHFHLTSAHYGLIAALIAIGELVGTSINSFFVEKTGIRVMNRFATFFLGIIGFVFLILYFVGIHSVIAIIALSFSVTAIIGVILPNVSAEAFSLFDKNIGLVGSTYGAIQISIVVISTTLLSLCMHPSIGLLGIGFILISIICLLLG
jgi:Bcr/CflA subfamily drug resistance transporter